MLPTLPIALLAAVLGASDAASLQPNNFTRILPTVITPNFEGWGTSLAWWSVFAGQLSRCQHKKLIDLLFSRKAYPSLALNIVRYNIGGSPPLDATGKTPADPLLGQYRGVPSMQKAPGVWDWTADMAQLRVMAAARDEGASVFEAFSNSPPWWMTISGTSRGRYEGGDNLDPANFTRFADHLVTVVNYLRRTHGFNITSLEPFNEPNSMWWQASRTQGGQQEGCTFQPATQKAFLPVLSNMMKARGLQGLVDLTSADEFAYNWAQFNQWGGADYSLTAKANVHGYGFAVSQEWNQQRLNWRRTVPASVGRAWMSELGGFGQTPQNVASMASNIVLDLNIARVTAWVFWQVLDGHPDWTLLRPMSSCLSCSWFDPNRFDPVPAPGFYGLMQFSNHIQRGSKILASSRSSDLDACVVCVVVAHLPSKSELVIVAVNNDDTATFNHLFDLSAIPSAVAASRSTGAAGSPSPLVTLAYRTWPAQQEFHAAVARPVVTAAAAFVYALPPLSTTTFLLRSVTL